MPHPAELPIEQLLESCDVRRQRRSGPGGQHRNKVETAVMITHRPTGCTGDASERRSQEQNRKQAVARLRVNLAVEVRSERPDEPSELWRRRCVGKRISVSRDHDDFAAVLAEALDCLAACRWDAASAAARLACTSSQLIKLLKTEPRAIEQLNTRRSEQGLPPLK